MRTHTYTMNKGYDAPHKGQSISWPAPTTMEEAIPAFFKDEATLLQNAVAQLNIRKGHAVQEATKERPETKDGKTTGIDGSTLSLADLTKIATETNADSSIRSRSGGSQKQKATQYDTAKQKAAEIAAKATPEELALLRKLGFAPAADTGSAPQEAATPTVNAPKSHNRR